MLSPGDTSHDFHKGPDDLVHVCAWVYGAQGYNTCCQIRFGPTLVVYEGPTCMKCIACKGCKACTAYPATFSL